jgi:hypothetical protein
MRRGAQVSVGDARHGRRDNGLVAAEYAAAGDVDPRVGEHLLDVLALDGIAAYLRPSTDLHPVTRSTMLPSRPTDRLFVDRAYVATARDYLSRLAGDAEQSDDDSDATAEMDESSARTDDGGADDSQAPDPVAPVVRRMSEPTSDEVDRAWAEIIAGYEATAPSTSVAPTDSPLPDIAKPDTTKPETAKSDTDKPDITRPDTTRPETSRPDATRPDARPDRTRPDRPERDPAERERAARDRAAPERGDRDRPGRDLPELTPPYRIGPRLTSGPADEEPSLLDGLDTFGADLPGDDDDSFTPPIAPPVPRPSLPTALAVIGMVGGLAVFLRPDLLSFIGESLAMFLGFTAIVGGFGTLVWRLRPGDDEDDDPDNGARV